MSISKINFIASVILAFGFGMFSGAAIRNYKVVLDQQRVDLINPEGKWVTMPNGDHVCDGGGPQCRWIDENSKK